MDEAKSHLVFPECFVSLATRSFSSTNDEHFFTAHVSHADRRRCVFVTNDLPLINNQRSQNRSVNHSAYLINVK